MGKKHRKRARRPQSTARAPVQRPSAEKSSEHWPAPAEVPDEAFARWLASLLRDFEISPTTGEPPRPMDPILFGVTANLLESSVIDFFNRDLAYSGAGFLASLEVELSVDYRSYLAEDAFIRLARTWDYLVQALRDHLQLDREVNRDILEQLIGFSAREVEFLPHGTGGTLVRERWRDRREAVSQMRATRQRTRVLNVTKDVRQLRKAIERQFVSAPWISEFIALMRSPETRAARNIRDEITHVAPLSAMFKAGNNALVPGSAINVNVQLDWRERQIVFLDAHEKLGNGIAVLRNAVYAGDRPRSIANPELDTRVVVHECPLCGRRSCAPLAAARITQRNIEHALCAQCGSWKPREDPYQDDASEVVELGEDVFWICWRSYMEVLPAALERFEYEVA